MKDNNLEENNVKKRLGIMKTNLMRAAIYYLLGAAIVIGVPAILPFFGYSARILIIWALCMSPFAIYTGVKLIAKLKEYNRLKKECE